MRAARSPRPSADRGRRKSRYAENRIACRRWCVPAPCAQRAYPARPALPGSRARACNDDRLTRFYCEFLTPDRHLARGFIHNAALSAIATFYNLVTGGCLRIYALFSYRYGDGPDGPGRFDANLTPHQNCDIAGLFTQLSTGCPAAKRVVASRSAGMRVASRPASSTLATQAMPAACTARPSRAG